MRWSRLTYGLLLLAFPRRVRREFGDEMRQLFEDQWSEAASARARLALDGITAVVLRSARWARNRSESKALSPMRLSARRPAIKASAMVDSCTCPAECDQLDDRSGTPVHANGCRCHCDIA